MLPPDPTGACANVENCLDADGAYAALDALRALAPPVPVWVVGLPGTESFTDVLSEMARRGGTARAGDPAYYDARSVDGLSEALLTIAASTMSCTFDLDLAPVNPRKVRVTVDGVDVPHTADGAEGWDYADPDHTSVELLGSACALVRDGAAHEVGASYACEILF